MSFDPNQIVKLKKVTLVTIDNKIYSLPPNLVIERRKKS